MIRPNEDKPKDNETSVWTIATGNIKITKKKSREAVKYITNLKGFVGIHPTNEGILWLFDTKDNAIKGRNDMDSMGIVTGDNICEVFIDKSYLAGEEK